MENNTTEIGWVLYQYQSNIRPMTSANKHSNNGWDSNVNKCMAFWNTGPGIDIFEVHFCKLCRFFKKFHLICNFGLHLIKVFLYVQQSTSDRSLKNVRPSQLSQFGFCKIRPNLHQPLSVGFSHG